MCQNSFLERSEQIERCLEQGMPEKIIKAVVYTLKKRTKKTNNNNPVNAQTMQKEVQAEMLPENILKSQSMNSSESNLGPTLQPPASGQQTHVIESKEPAVVVNPSTPSMGIPRMCGRFRQQMQSSKLKSPTEIQNGNHDCAVKDESDKLHNDVLAMGTAYTKLCFEKINKIFEEFKKSKINTLLTQTTQPAHFVAICVLSAVVLTIWPDLIDSATPSKAGTDARRGGSSTLAAIVYLGAFATHFGAQIWMTFVSGLSLYFSLPRHTFGQCQQILFPKYFALNAILSIILLIIFVKCYLHSWTLAISVQFALLAMNPAIELIVRLYLAPPMLRLMHEKYKIEDAIGSGQEVGSLVQGDLTECPHYQRIHKAFRRLHMMVAMGNMIVLLATFIHLYFLATKIQINLS